MVMYPLIDSFSLSASVSFFLFMSENVSRSVVSNSLWPYGLLPTLFLCPWNSPGKNRGVGKPFPFPVDLPNPCIEPRSPVLKADSLLSKPFASTHICTFVHVYILYNLNTNNEFELNLLLILYPTIISALFDLKQKRENKWVMFLFQCDLQGRPFSNCLEFWVFINLPARIRVLWS